SLFDDMFMFLSLHELAVFLCSKRSRFFEKSTRGPLSVVYLRLSMSINEGVAKRVASITFNQLHHSYASNTSSPLISPNMAPTQQRDKRRFYVKKLAIGIHRFKEWEEQLDDSWYRHHNKVNNIVYYHCKHEPCYASMKAKVMVDFVQLYVTEEGHTHPPFTSSVAALSELSAPLSSSDFASRDSNQQMNSVTYQRSSLQSPKRRRLAEEQPSKEIPLIYQQQLLKLLHLQGDSSAESSTVENSRPQNQTETQLTSLFICGQCEESCSTMANSVEIKHSLPITSDSDRKRGNSEGNESTIQQIMRNSCEPTSHISPCSSSEARGEVQTHGAVENIVATVSPQSETKDSENYEDCSDSEQSTEDSLSSSTPISLKVEGNNQTNISADSGDGEEIFTMIRALVESKPRRKRLVFLRKLKRQLNYYVEMEEIRSLAARLPPNTTFHDVFNS
uniref:FLYWCH-type domain-containing protein n=2 Tax=Parascaris univalens TaxID=6257 RepID=A0A915C7P1_PARUN